MVRWVERALNLRPGDLGRGVLLCSSLFLIMSSYVIGRIARDALFLGRFQAVQLPYVDIASAALVGFVVAGYMRMAKWVSLRNLLVVSELFFALTFPLFWVFAHYYRLTWTYAVFYTWVSVFGVLATAQVWTLANYVLTTREAKRVFGVVGAGAIAGWIFAGFFSKTLVKAFGTESLLLCMALLLLPCPVLVYFTWRSGQAHLGSSDQLIQATGSGTGNLLQGMRLVFSSGYLRSIAAVIWISSFVTTLTGWQFKAIAKQVLVNKDAMAVFFSNFNFYAAIASLIFQLLVTSRFLRKFGLGAALFALPLTVLLGSTGVLIWGTLEAVVALKAFDQVLRYSLDRSTAELLYLPIPSRIKMQVKWFIDTVIWRLGDGFSGLTVLIFATYLHVAARSMSWIALVLTGGWLASVFVARRQYVATLADCISKHRLDAEQASAPVLDRSTSDLLASKLVASDPKEILYALSLFEVERTRASHPVIRGLLRHPTAEVRQKAITTLSVTSDKTVLPQVQELLRDPDLSVRTEALLYLTHHSHVDPLNLIEELGDFPDFSVRSAVVAFLARPGDTQNLETARAILDVMVNESGPDGTRPRREAALLLGDLPDCFDPLLSVLMSDKDIEVARQAMRSIGKLRKRRLVPDLLDRLTNAELSPQAGEALASMGDTSVGVLRDHLADPSVSIEIRREIPRVLLGIGTSIATQVLLDHLLESDTTLRFRIISALNKLLRVHPEIKPDAQMLETVLAAEILGHYRSYQILHMLGPAGAREDPVGAALYESMQQELERIFRLMGMLYPHLDVHSAYVGLQSKDLSVHDNAIEFLDTVLNAQMRELLVPLLDGRVTIAERADLAVRLVRAKLESPEQAVAALVSSDDPWLKSCGAYAIGSLGLVALEHELDLCLQHPDPLLRETAREAKLRLQQTGSPAQPGETKSQSAPA